MLTWKTVLIGSLCVALTLDRGAAVAAGAPQTLLDVQKAPIAQTRTVEHHVLLGCAARDADQPALVAEAIAVVGLLPAQVAPRSLGMVGAELPRLREYLWSKAEQLYKKAIAAHDAGDLKTAVKSYLVALKCDPAVMSRDDRGLGKRGLEALRKVAAKPPERPDLKFQLGWYSHLFGDAAGAVAALEAHQAVQIDPYKLWRAGLWLARIRAEVNLSAAPAAQPGGAIAPTAPARD